jgi:hypothetical protein
MRTKEALPMRVISSLILLSLTGCCLSADSGFEFADFSSIKGLKLIEAAFRHKDILRLTSAERAQAGAVWYAKKQPVLGGFRTTFAFRLTDQDGKYKGADGLAFVVQNESVGAIGACCAAGGFARTDDIYRLNGGESVRAIGAPLRHGISPKLAIFFDTYQDVWERYANCVVVCTQTTKDDMRWPLRCLSYSQPLSVNLKDGAIHTVQISYEPPRLSIYVDNLPEPVQAVSVDVAGIVGGNGTAWVGFTAATGGGYENHDLLNWKFDLPPGTATDSNIASVDSTISSVDSTISFAPVPCVPGRKLCTPEKAVIQETSPGRFHVYLPANREWGASVPNPAMVPVQATNVKGVVCWDPRLREGLGCNGPAGNGVVPGDEVEGGAGFVAPHSPAGSLVGKSLNGHTYFTVNDRTGAGFKDNEGYFEFDVMVGRKK